LSEVERVRVLYLEYGMVHFLLDSRQCSASAYAGEVVQCRSTHKYLYELLQGGDDLVLLFDLNRFLCDSFRVQHEGSTDLAIIGRLDRFSEQSSRLLQDRVFPRLAHLDVAVDKVAFRLPSSAQIIELESDVLLPHPFSLAQHLERYGLSAVHMEHSSCGFMLDLDLLIASRLLFSRTSVQETDL